MNPKITSSLAYLGVFLVVGALSFYAFGTFVPLAPAGSNLLPEPKIVENGPKKTGILNFEGPLTEICPLNGALYTKQESDLWSQKRPMVVMIENHADSRPQSGLSNADIVYEAVAEGGITRFMGVFYCAAQRGAGSKYDVGPVRSARTYFLDLASEYADYPLYVHVGGANCSAATPGGPCTTNRKALALEQIQSYGWMNKGTWSDMSEFSLPYRACRREPERTGDVKATEHTMYCSTKEMWAIASSRGLTNQTELNNSSWDKKYRPWTFNQKDIPALQTSAISFDFWPGYKDYSVGWQYNLSTNSYARSNNSLSSIDFNTQEQLSAKNIVVQYVKETRSIDEHSHNLYEVIGSGKGHLFQNGNKIEITWSKANRQSRTIYKDSSGKEVSFVPGLIWVEILPSTSVVKYEGATES